MHERSMALSMVRLLEQAAEGSRSRRVHRARLRIGELCCLDPAALERAFGIAAAGTAAEGCVLEIRRVAAVLRCRGCGGTRGGPLPGACPACGARDAVVLQGGEAWIESLDVEGPEAPAPLGGSAL